MEITVKRNIASSKSTLGRLFIDGKPLCYTLEDVCRDLNKNGSFDNGEAKIHGKTAILAGRYKVIVNVSNRFKKRMPLLLDTPHFMGIRIHSGNVPEDTEGCILVGLTKAQDFVGNSRDAFKLLMEKLDAVPKGEQIYITVTDVLA